MRRFLKKNEKKILTKEYKFGNIVIVNKDEDTKKRKANKMLRKDKKGEKNIER